MTLLAGLIMEAEEDEVEEDGLSILRFESVLSCLTCIAASSLLATALEWIITPSVLCKGEEFPASWPSMAISSSSSSSSLALIHFFFLLKSAHVR